jgi:hypothetical protein
MPSKSGTPGKDKLDKVVAEARRDREARERDYRARALRMYPWICGRCSREFTRENVHELTVHHRDHDHDNNPSDGSNWELLCVYCHDNEHARHQGGVDSSGTTSSDAGDDPATHKPFADLDSLLKRDD